MAISVEVGSRERILRLRDDVMARGCSCAANYNPFARDVALWRAAQTPGRSRVQLRAAALVELVRLAPVEILPEWTIAGEQLLSPDGRYAHQLPNSSEQVARMAELGVREDQFEAVRQCARDWFGTGPWPYLIGRSSGRDTAPDPSPPNSITMPKGWMENHSIRDYAKLLRIGYLGLRKEAEAQLAAGQISDPDYPRKENFLLAVLDVCDAGCLLGQRYAELARALAAQADDPAERDRLTAIAKLCERVPSHGATTLREAVQALWFGHLLTCGEDGVNANSIGRLDQILWPYYEADRYAGRIGRDQALELMAELACKLYRHYDVQAITLGGVDAEGHDATNELTFIILEATAEVGFVRDLSVRIAPNSPPELIDASAQLIARGGGIPFLFNDNCFLPALSERGIPIEDARDYAPIGCVELTIPGKANPHAVSGWLNAAKCLELALFGGVDPRTGAKVGQPGPTLAEMTSIDEVWDAYQQQIEHFSREMAYLINRGELSQTERGPMPGWSTLTDDCIARGRDITDGGAQYFYHSICFIGTANVADSLMALQKLVFDDKRVEQSDLLEALQADFEGCEDLRQLLALGAPKYGNDLPEVDAWAARVANTFIDLMDTFESPLGGRYFVHLFSFYINLSFGKAVGATPDGRRANEPLAYSLSAQQGRDVDGVTALLSSLAKMPHERAAGGSAAIIDLDPAAVEGPDGWQRLAQLIRAAFAMGIGQLQWNVVNEERLRQAQEDPEHYGNLSVRVAGYSQMFRLLSPELQEHVIARTKHRS